MNRGGRIPDEGKAREKQVGVRFSEEYHQLVFDELPYVSLFVRNVAIVMAKLKKKNAPKDEIIKTVGEIAYNSAYSRIDITSTKVDEQQLKMWVDDEP